MFFGLSFVIGAAILGCNVAEWGFQADTSLSDRAPGSLEAKTTRSERLREAR